MAPRSYGVEIRLRLDDHELWTGNALRFATFDEAEWYGAWHSLHFASRCAPTWRVIPSNLQPNARWPLCVDAPAP